MQKRAAREKKSPQALETNGFAIGRLVRTENQADLNTEVRLNRMDRAPRGEEMLAKERERTARLRAE